jgi:hypothetical protein
LVRSLSCMSATEPRYCPISTLHRKLRQGTGSKGRARAAVTRRLCTIAGFYKYTVEEELLEHLSAARVRRPRVDYESHAAALDRNGLGATGSRRARAADRACAARAERAERAAGLRGHRRRHRAPRSGTRPPDCHDYPQGGKVVTILLAPHTARAIDLVIGERTGVPGVPGRGRRGGWTRTPLRSSPPTPQAPPGNRSTSWKSSARRSQHSSGCSSQRPGRGREAGRYSRRPAAVRTYSRERSPCSARSL